jgi:hypothetical protein
MNIIDEWLNNRKIFATLAVVATFSITGLIFATYYQSQAKASYEGLPTVEFKAEDYSNFKQSLAAPTINYTNPDKTATPISIDSVPTKISVMSLNGDYKGTKSSLYKPDLQFSKSLFTISNDTNFSFSGEGLDLSLLGNPLLRIEGQYPSVNMTITGSILMNTDKIAQLTITKVQTEFRISNQPLDTSNTQRLINIFQTSGITLPNPSKAVPLYRQGTFIPAENKLSLESTPESTFKFKFVGVKI